ncbi:MobA/MobL family protein [Pseudolysobacter antarcticus]|uniref:MobA/MobL family protein n=1 Tax=Pseudolysobacter antarcticus TaxID=2511995 RepID=UPI0013EBE81B|nr:MobA/MobL family protein [Pseudolysobacter antarcticus]
MAAAAYRAGTQAGFRDERTGVLHTYGRKRGIVSVDIHVPKAAPAWARDPEKLWNHAEAAERRVNARVAFEWIIALPAELNGFQRAALVADLSHLLVDRYAVATMAAIHAPDTHGDQRNHHVHLMTSTRSMGATGFGAKVRALVDQKTGPLEIEAVRAHVAALTNQHLERAGISERVDHQRLLVQARKAEAQGDFGKAALLTREATIHEGQASTAAARRGERLERSGWNAMVHASNAQLLEKFVAAAQQGGRWIEAPARSGADQAQADRTREVAAATPGADSRAGRPTPSKGRAGRTPAGSKLTRQKLSATGGRGTRAQGRDADVLNTQASQASDSRRVERDSSQRYMDMLQSVIEENGQRAAEAVAYARLWNWPSADVHALAAHRVADPRCGVLLRQGIDAATQRTRAHKLGERRRARHGAAMFATARERQAAERAEENQPPAWKPKTRREWADLRRKQRAKLGQAERREWRAQVLVSAQAMSRYVSQAQAAAEKLEHIESRRAAGYPVPGDAMRSKAATLSIQGKARPVFTRRHEPAKPRPNAFRIPPPLNANLEAPSTQTRRRHPRP